MDPKMIVPILAIIACICLGLWLMHGGVYGYGSFFTVGGIAAALWIGLETG